MKTFSKGTVRKHRKPSGAWEWQAVIIVTDGDTKKQMTRMTGYACTPPDESEKVTKGRNPTPSGKGAKAALDFVKTWRDELVAADAAAAPNATDETVTEFVQRYVKTLDIEPATEQTYRYLLNHIRLLAMPIAELTPQDVEQWKNEMEEGGVGAHMRNKAFNLLKYACGWGVGIEILTRNPLSNVKAPARPKHEPNPLDPSEITRLLECVDSIRGSKPEFADMVELALNTGMRRGELCALRWCDVDGYEDGSFTGCIHVNNVVATREGGTYIKNYPKNGNRRTIPINEAMRAVLSRRLDAMRSVTRNLSKCYVFGYLTSPDVYPAPSYITKLWNMFIALNNFVGVEGKPLRFHDLRDTFATAALVNEIPVITVAAILGHESSTTTYKHYAHFIPSKNEDAMNQIGNILNAG